MDCMFTPIPASEKILLHIFVSANNKLDRQTCADIWRILQNPKALQPASLCLCFPHPLTAGSLICTLYRLPAAPIQDQLRIDQNALPVLLQIQAFIECMALSQFPRPVLNSRTLGNIPPQPGVTA